MDDIYLARKVAIESVFDKNFDIFNKAAMSRSLRRRAPPTLDLSRLWIGFPISEVMFYLDNYTLYLDPFLDNGLRFMISIAG